MLTSAKSREHLRTVRTVIVDEIHALARDKRGSHLALTLERLEHLCARPLTRIGLSATQRPIEELAWFLVGDRPSVEAPGTASRPTPDCTIVDVGHIRTLDLGVEVPPSELAAVCSHEQWGEIHARLVECIQAHRSTLIFVNTRRMSERIAHQLRGLLGDEAVASHHGSMSRELRLSAEQRLKQGKLRAIVATASLEMGIDIGYIDLVCQIGSPRSIAAFLQRVGRAGHSIGATPKGRLFPLTRDELLESMALLRAVRAGLLDRIEIPRKPLDILAQQIVAAVACDDWNEPELRELIRRAGPYRDLSDSEFNEIVEMLSRGLTPTVRRGAYLHRDRIHGKLRARKAARLAAIMSGGAIPEQAEFRVVTENDRTLVGTVEEDFAIDSSAGDIFVLGNTSWQICHVRGGEVVVRDAQGAPPSVPFWFGEGLGRTPELSAEVSRLRQEIAEQFPPPGAATHDASDRPVPQPPTETSPLSDLDRLCRRCGVSPFAATQAIRYVQAQVASVGLVPTRNRIVFERFFDESGGMQLVIHAPLGSRINRAWGLALRKRFCRSFDFELQAAATDNGIVLSLSPQHSFPIEQLFKMLGPHNAEDLLQQAILAVPMFQVRWRWNVTRALAVLRNQSGQRVPFHLQRFRADDLLAATFPETVGCLENHHGDVVIPDHPLVRQTVLDCLREAMDTPRWLDVLAEIRDGAIELIPRETREPSPFSHELLNASPYAFLDGAGLDERRTRAVKIRRSLTIEDAGDLTQLSPEAIRQVSEEAWPTVRDPEELHDALLQMVQVRGDELAPWQEWLPPLKASGRVARFQMATEYWTAAEHLPMLRVVYPTAEFEPCAAVQGASEAWEASAGWTEIVRGRMPCSGPVTADELADKLGLESSQVSAALEALESQGAVMRGRYSPERRAENVVEWCDRRLLARIHRLTMDGLRRRIQPVSVKDFLRFLTHHHQLTKVERTGPLGVRAAVEQLQGFEVPAGAWEFPLLQSRVCDYDPDWLDQLFLSGELVWGRFLPPVRSAESAPSRAPLTRAMSLALGRREDLDWLLPAPREDLSGHCRANARLVLDALQQRGALFLGELKAITELLPTHLEEALRELAALGLITSDGFAAVRSLIGTPGILRRSTRQRPRTQQRLGQTTVAVGRWSRFPSLEFSSRGRLEGAERERYVTRWCWQLIRRYGVVFRDLLARESAAPAWGELTRVFRKLETRGELRGGRFVSGVGGEQYAEESTVTKLREIRERPEDDPWVIISAADPLNLRGIIDTNPRVPAIQRHTMVIQNGEYVAASRRREIEFLRQVELPLAQEMRRAMLLGIRHELCETPDTPPGDSGAMPRDPHAYRWQFSRGTRIGS
jgi:ATP-dependent Lhr-like helicase